MRDQSAGNNSFLRWSEVNIFSPPVLNDTTQEALRLNELLARPQVTCSHKIRIGEEPTFAFCNDSKYFADGKKIGEVFVISGSTTEDKSFIESLNPSRWTMFVTQGFEPLEELEDVGAFLFFFPTYVFLVKHVELRYLLDLRENDDWELDSVISAVLKTKQLQLVVNIDVSDGNRVISQWYNALYRLFFNYNYALFSADSSSPLEERKRFLTYLLDKNEGYCFKKVRGEDTPSFCTNFLSNSTNCSVLLVKYGIVTSDDIQYPPSCQITVVSPVPNPLSGSVYRSFNVGISLKSNEDMQIPSSEVSEPWRLVPLSKIIQNISLETTHLLMLDLEGSEWDVFDCILSTPELDRMKYIGLKLRLWTGEENENYRKFLLHFLNLEKKGFRKVAGVKVTDNSFEVLYKSG
ncbi:unnamed protein product [Enterobius vermicularis]|uniref:Methyltransf_21 domain-containing protein n=1 Tax=Enterobius vermicularis TaxID=51028 RepID=A0A0N4VJU4_ENTVE|nr:unnamed protein product [Enterobius vermicularis]